MPCFGRTQFQLKTLFPVPSLAGHVSFSSLPNLHHLYLGGRARDISSVAGLLSNISIRSLTFLQLELVVDEEEIPSVPAHWEELNESLLRPSISVVEEIAFPVYDNMAKFPEDKVLELLPALKGMNVVEPWSAKRYRGAFSGDLL